MSTNCHLLLWLRRRLRMIHWVCREAAGRQQHRQQGGRQALPEETEHRESTVQHPPHMCMHTHMYPHTVKYEKEGRNWGAVKGSACPGRRGLTVVASLQPQGFNATLISGGLDIPDHSLLISCESAFPAQMSTFCGRFDSTGKRETLHLSWILIFILQLIKIENSFHPWMMWKQRSSGMADVVFNSLNFWHLRGNLKVINLSIFEKRHH